MPLLVHLRHVQGFRGLSFDSCRGCIELAFNLFFSVCIKMEAISCEMYD